MSMKRIIYSIAVALLLLSCNTGKKAEDYMSWLYKYMPMQDSLGFSKSWWLANVEKTLEVRKLMGWNVPENEFRHFVLPLRVNNEYLDDFRTIYADTLCKRVKGMTMEQAALEINHWCFEQATYRGSDARTMSPASVAKCGFGRCGEESVLAVSALRAAGIPARQVYTPRWAHTDDNHAWVEAWIDGEWHFMGACEPEPVLDLGWFNAPVSRALVLTTNVFGDYNGPESVIERNDCFTKINLIGSYVPHRTSIVTIVDTLGNIVPDADVEFTIYNYGNFSPVIKLLSDNKGQAKIEMGLGAMLIRASKDGRFGMSVLDTETSTVVLNHKIGDVFSADFNLVPPPENPLPSKATKELTAENKLKLEKETQIRNSHNHTNPAIVRFKEKYGSEADRLLDCLSKKDIDDVSYDVLEDALLSKSQTDKNILSPRVELEPLAPFRKEVLDRGLDQKLKSFEDVDRWVAENIKIVHRKAPSWLRMPPVVVLKSGCSDEGSINIFKVALCRAVGLSASMDDVTGNTSMELENMKKGRLILKFDSNSDIPEYYRDFTISRYDFSKVTLLNFGEDTDNISLGTMNIPELEAGYYCITTGKRLPDGSVLARMEFFNITPDSNIVKEISIRTGKEDLSIKGQFNPDSMYLNILGGRKVKFSELPASKYYILAILGSRDEPSMHIVRNLKTFINDPDFSSIPILVSGNKALDGISKNIIRIEDNELLFELSASCKVIPKSKPVVILCSKEGNIYYISQGYNPVLNTHLKYILSSLVLKN